MTIDHVSPVFVLRLGHRPLRDKRITTHVGLVSRAFGADGFILTVEDRGVVGSLEDVRERWGGDFDVKVVRDWSFFLREWKGMVVHLTMYGAPLNRRIAEIRDESKRHGPLLVVVGAEKVPPEVYKRADYNISVGTQPHSEVSALAIFLDRFFEGKGLDLEFEGSLRVVPSDDGKKVFME